MLASTAQAQPRLNAQLATVDTTCMLLAVPRLELASLVRVMDSLRRVLTVLTVTLLAKLVRALLRLPAPLATLAHICMLPITAALLATRIMDLASLDQAV